MDPPAAPFDGHGTPPHHAAPPAGAARARDDLPPFDQVVVEHGPVVLRVCRAVVGRDDADDAWGDTFLAALAAYPRLLPGSDVRAWLVTIAHRKAIDRWRSARRRPLPVGALPERPDGRPDLEAPDEVLWAAVAALAPLQRQAVAYRYLADLPYAQIGALLGTSEAAARRSAADGLKRLRAALPSEVIR